MSFWLVGSSGKSYGYASNSNRLKDRFLESGEESAQVVVTGFPDIPPLVVTRDTPNSEWNKFYNKYGRV